jgi:hypothetical protein
MGIFFFQKEGLEHASRNVDSCSDLAIDMCLFHLCMLALFVTWMGYVITL